MELIKSEITRQRDYSKKPSGTEYTFDIEFNAVTSDGKVSLTVIPNQAFVDKYQGSKANPGPTRNWNYASGVEFKLPQSIAITNLSLSTKYGYSTRKSNAKLDNTSFYEYIWTCRIKRWYVL